MFLVGLSGGIASGKSTVVDVLRELGCAVIDADAIAREVVRPHCKAYGRIVRCFGTEILSANGEINREALGNIIFSQPEKRQLLNSITHPEILKEMLKQILKYFVRGYRYVILDIPLLFETKTLTKFMKYTVLVYCGPPTQLSRLMRRNGLSRAQPAAAGPKAQAGESRHRQLGGPREHPAAGPAAARPPRGLVALPLGTAGTGHGGGRAGRAVVPPPPASHLLIHLFFLSRKMPEFPGLKRAPKGHVS
ncbi:dephospho-CoA kinase domain containing [Columba livia]|uniref:Dephospho-CoA kinase domain containing n=1 Tax=Columba livia TaxID=8932 RepID=A0A2I0LNR1_COLLI|nr:dephospho-CoA kinase domain containing [Columba livia]